MQFDGGDRFDIRGQIGSGSFGVVYEAFDRQRNRAVAIATLHAHGVIHRDIKPSNIMITPEGRVALLDFGLVVGIELDDSVDRKTVAGTPGYMSPEQIQGSPSTPATDWYSFGVLLYQALTGALPFTGTTPLEIVESQRRGDQISPAAVVPGISDDLDSLCRDLLRPDPSARPDTQQILSRLGAQAFGTRREERMRSRSPLFIGRSKEMKELMREFRAAQRGEVRVVLLHGSPGAGKSTLADQFLDTLRDAGAFLIGGRCHPWESVPLNA